MAAREGGGWAKDWNLHGGGRKSRRQRTKINDRWKLQGCRGLDKEEGRMADGGRRGHCTVPHNQRAVQIGESLGP